MTSAAPTTTPYHRAKNVWNERYQNLVRARWNWQIIAFGELFVIAMFAMALVWHSTQSKVVPYIVRVDDAGQSLVIGAAEGTTIQDQRVIGWQLQSFVREVRQVTADRTAQKALLDHAYVQTVGAAVPFLNEYFRAEATNPFVRNRSSIVMPAVKNTLRLGDSNSWQVEWVETVRSLEGKLAEEQTWIGQFDVEIAPPSTPEEIIANPLGFKVTRISWSRKY